MHPSKVPYTLDNQIARYLDGDLGVYRPAIGPGWHNSKSLQFQEKSIKKAAETRKIVLNNMYTYSIKRLSVTYQKAMASNVNKRMIKLLGHSSTVNRDPEFRHEAMMDD